MKKLILLIIISFFWQSLMAQAPVIDWQYCIGGTDGDIGRSVCRASDNGYVVTGYVQSSNGNVTGNHGAFDVLVAKFGVGGNIQWQKCFGGTGMEEGNCIQNTNDGGFIIAGYTSSNDGDVSGYLGMTDIWVLKIDSIGNIEWQKCLGGSNEDYGNFIEQTFDGGYILTGTTVSTDGDVSGLHGTSAPDIWTVKLNSNGIIEWQKCFGGLGYDYSKEIHSIDQGSYIIVGSTSSIDGDVSGIHSSGYLDAWVIEIDSSGNLLWQKCLGGTNDDFGSSIKSIANNGFIFLGSAISNNGDVSGHYSGPGTDMWIVELDSLGNIQWQKCLGGNTTDSGTQIQLTSDGGYIVIGNTGSTNGDVSGIHGTGTYDIWLVKLDSLASISWQKCLGGNNSDNGMALLETIEGDYVITGQASSNNGDISGFQGVYDFWTVKLSILLSNQEFLKENQIHGSPNPTLSTFTLSGIAASEISAIEILDITGKLLFTTNSPINIDLSNYENGVYLYRIIGEKNYTSKIVKE